MSRDIKKGSIREAVRLHKRRVAMNPRSIIEKAKSASRTLLNEIESKALLSEAGISVIETELAISRQEAIVKSKELGFPVVLKVVSAEITHKSDVGG
jgi:acetyltransferase